jgi:predicted acyltransferase
VGVVIPFSLARLQERGESRAALHARIARRTVLLFALGLLCNGVLQFDFANLRVAGVLQRIALCYGCTALIVLHTGVRGQAAALVVILLGYWALLALVPAPGSAPGDYSMAGNLPGYIDRHFLPGKIMKQYYGYGDNEGILSTVPAVATTLLGALAGHWLRSGRSPASKLLGLSLAGVVSLLLGTAWGAWFPVIKNLWTSSYVLVAGGWSLLLLAFFYGVIDVLGLRRWAFFFIVIGANAITIYVVRRFIDFPKIARFFLGGLIRHSGSFAPVALAMGVLAVEWLFLLYLYRRRLFLRV